MNPATSLGGTMKDSRSAGALSIHELFQISDDFHPDSFEFPSEFVISGLYSCFSVFNHLFYGFNDVPCLAFR